MRSISIRVIDPCSRPLFDERSHKWPTYYNTAVLKSTFSEEKHIGKIVVKRFLFLSPVISTWALLTEVVSNDCFMQQKCLLKGANIVSVFSVELERLKNF